MVTDPRKKKKPLDGYGTVTEQATAPQATPTTTPATGTLTEAQRELQAAYGVHIGADGSIQKGTATDQAYQEAVNRYMAAANNQYYTDAQKIDDDRYTQEVQRYRKLADQSRDELARSRDQSRREAGIMMERIGRYMGNVGRVSGTAGSGAGNADAIRRYNEVLRQMESADRSYEAGVIDVGNTEAQNIANADIAKRDADAVRQYQIAESNYKAAQEQINIDDKFRVENQAASSSFYENTLMTAMQSKLNQLASKWGDGKISEADMKELRTYAGSISGSLTAQDRQNLEVLLGIYESDYVRTSEEAKMVEETVTGATVKGFMKEAKSGRNLTVTLNGEPYDVQIEKIMEPEDDANVAARAQQVPADTVFEIGGSLYVKMSGNDDTKAGTVVKLERRTLEDDIIGDFDKLKQLLKNNNTVK